MKKKPNVLLLFADDLRFDTIACVNNPEIITPNLDWLVSRGTTYTQAHIPSGTSAAVCMPSRAMLHTGRHLFSLDGEGQEINPNHALMGETLQANGYDTFGTGKWHNGIKAYARSFNHGDQIFFGGMDDHWCVPCHKFDPTGEYPSRVHKVKNYMYERGLHTFIADHITAGKHSTELFAEATSGFINNHSGDKPFFAYTSFMAPHDPRTMPNHFKEMYDINQISLPKNFAAMHHIEYANTACRDEVLAAYPRTAEETKQHILEYYAMITHIDEEVGKIIDTLKDKGILDETIIIFTADNGLGLGQHGLFGKQNHYDHSIRVPFVISGPDIPVAEMRDDMIYVLDIFPTICELAEIAQPETVEGISFAKGIVGEAYDARKSLYFAYTDKIRSVKNEQFKLMTHTYEGIVTKQLFDLKNDPWEKANLIDSEAYKEVVGTLETELMTFRKSWKDEDHKFGKSFWGQYDTITNIV